MKNRMFLLFIIISFQFSQLQAQQIAKGFVFEDLNGNNKKEKKEKGISGVAVSNGIDVVLTTSKGEYQIPVDKDHILFVIKPGNYDVPVNQYNQPQFFYNHKPGGSPLLKYPGLKSTGKLPVSVDFPLIARQEADEFSILVFGDPQPYNLKELDYFYRGIIKELADIQNYAFGLSLGDLVGDDLDLFIPYKNAVKQAGIPWYNVMGNHDLNFDVVSDSLADETFEREFGPSTYAFNHGKVHFIILDDILYPDPRDGKGYWGGFTQNQLKFIENNLQFVPKDHLIVLAFHIPISENDPGDPFRDSDRNKLFELLKDFPNTLSMSAHTHFQSQDFIDAKHGWLQEKPHHHFNVGTTSGDWYSGRLNEEGIPVSTMRDGTPKGYVLLHFNKNQYSFDYKVAGKPKDYYFEIYAPKVVGHNKYTWPMLAVNFFIGSEKDSLFYRIDDGKWHKMTYRRDFDPNYYRKVMDWDFTDSLFAGSRPSNPVHSSHLWFGRVPTNLNPGVHTIEIRAHDMFGRVLSQKRTYRIEATE